MKSFVNEGEFNRWWSAELRKCNALVLNVVGGLMQDSGWPDRYVCHKMWTGWIEGKVDERVVTETQKHIILELSKRNVPAYILRLNRRNNKNEMTLEHPVKKHVGYVPWNLERQGITLLDCLIKFDKVVFDGPRIVGNAGSTT